MAPGSSPAEAIDGDFPALALAVQRHFDETTADPRGAPPLFVTDTPNLYDVFLDALPPALRPVYVCAACRSFVQRFGGVVRITPSGKTKPVMWNEATAGEPFVPAIRALAAAVSRAPVVGVFLSTEKVWGKQVSGGWSHYAITPPPALVFAPSAIQTRAQRVAEKREDHAILLRGLEEFPLALVTNAHTLLTTGSLYRSEKCIGVAKWLMDLHEQRRDTRDARARDNLTWLAVATAPAGFCHVRSSMIGTLLEDLAAKLPFVEIERKFAAKMHPLQYQRPTAAPSAGNIAQAEKVMEQLRSAGSLERRFAKLEDIVALWRPTTPGKPPVKGLFGHLKAKRPTLPAAVEAPAVTMTWDKFSRTVLPTAETIEYLVTSARRPYLGMVTAKNPEAPPILQWDSEKLRNPVSSYVYHGGSTPEKWNLKAGGYHPVTAVSMAPWMWHDVANKFSHQGESAVLVLEGARDTTYQNGAGFFPEFLKSDYHAIRATIEAYAKSAVVEGKDEASACGIVLQKGSTWNYHVRVTSKGGVRVEYQLDRWD